jgi:hypothetical protein
MHGYLHVVFQSWEQAYQASVGDGLIDASVSTMTTML